VSKKKNETAPMLRTFISKNQSGHGESLSSNRDIH
jgi:hypothetical protein